MSSKDKLIEFLDNAGIWYLEYPSDNDGATVETNLIFYYFDSQGCYLDSHKS